MVASAAETVRVATGTEPLHAAIVQAAALAAARESVAQQTTVVTLQATVPGAFPTVTAASKAVAQGQR